MPATTQSRIMVALNEVMKTVSVVSKDQRNNSQGFNFRGIDAVLNAVAPALRQHGVVVFPTVLENQYDTVVSSNGKAMSHIIVKVQYTFMADDGSSIESIVYGESMDVGDKAMPKAMSVAFRTALIQALALPTDELDPDAESYERGVAKPKVELPQNIVDLISGATTREELDVIATQIKGSALNEDVKYGLGVLWSERVKALLKPVAMPTSTPVAPPLSLPEIEALHKKMTKPEKLDFYSNVISAGLPSIEGGLSHLTPEQQLQVLEIAKVITTPKVSA